jgi:hypothetical protein
MISPRARGQHNGHARWIAISHLLGSDAGALDDEPL